jgi:hypothetical protein
MKEITAEFQQSRRQVPRAKVLRFLRRLARCNRPSNLSSNETHRSSPLHQEGRESLCRNPRERRAQPHARCLRLTDMRCAARGESCFVDCDRRSGKFLPVFSDRLPVLSRQSDCGPVQFDNFLVFVGRERSIIVWAISPRRFDRRSCSVVTDGNCHARKETSRECTSRTTRQKFSRSQPCGVYADGTPFFQVSAISGLMRE